MSSRPVAARPSALYRVSLAAVAVAMAVLPVLYAALTALAAWGVYLFATRCFAAVWEWPIGGSWITLAIKIVCSCTPLLVGGAVVIAMIKPLFARRAAHMQPLALNPEVEPRVYGLVQEVCAIVGAPMPRRIELSCDLNASAGYERGLGGFVRNRLILTLGLPLVAGVTQRELAGIVAHEFGHFRQGAGMRVCFLIRGVNRWFSRVVYERDAWDQTLDDWLAGSSESIWMWIMASCVHLGVALSRGVLRLLMLTGHAVSAVLSRQMEYDADRSEMRVAGSAAFESATVKLRVLGEVFGDIHQEMARQWRRKFQLPDNLPVLIEHRAMLLPSVRREQLENEAGLSRTRWHDTHPSAADRVRRARQAGEAGYEISDAPARELFEHFHALSRMVTLAHYEDDLQVPTQEDFLIPVEQVMNPETAPATEKPARPVVPMMSYDPSRFKGRGQ